ncbi:hypothetical protein RND71_009790 [Anisodus tanguticus]|uniref:Uncharacterized protein n=1 Tax=Anisodus tanguticus TaxID=243964 RepID=A0AAE1VS63_9SOLA|nr:hypothetical protein RND71_009790 [Anisodus tanguticus]
MLLTKITVTWVLQRSTSIDLEAFETTVELDVPIIPLYMSLLRPGSLVVRMRQLEDANCCNFHLSSRTDQVSLESQVQQKRESLMHQCDLAEENCSSLHLQVASCAPLEIMVLARTIQEELSVHQVLMLFQMLQNHWIWSPADIAHADDEKYMRTVEDQRIREKSALREKLEGVHLDCESGK